MKPRIVHSPEVAEAGVEAMDFALKAEIKKIVFPCVAKFIYLDGREVVKQGVFEENVDDARKQGVKVVFV